MKDNILKNIDDPKELENLYRLNKLDFRREFNSLYPDIKDNRVAEFWNSRLNYESPAISWGSRSDVAFVIIASLIAFAIAKIPAYFPVDETFFYMRNAGFIVFPLLIFYFAWKNSMSSGKIIIVSTAVLIPLIYINLLPVNDSSDTLRLACIHLPLFLWALLGFTYAGSRLNDYRKRIEYLRYNGDILIMTGLLLIAGAILTGITVTLFSFIGLEIFDFYRNYFVILGLSAAPFVGNHIVQKNPQLVNKISPVIAKIFGPLVLVTLVVYLIAIIVTGKDPYNDREFLIAFNGLLIVVMAIIVFSLAETVRTKRNKAETLILFLLSSVTIVVNCVALSAILFRISEWGITPNRLAVLGGNLLILTNLLLVTYKLFRTVMNKGDIDEVEKVISYFLPVYTIWTLIVIFIFPVMFGFR